MGWYDSDREFLEHDEDAEAMADRIRAAHASLQRYRCGASCVALRGV